MKVAIIGTRGLPARYGGFETLADRLSHGLAQRGHAVTVYGRTGQGQEARVEVAPGLTALRMPTLSARGTETISAGFAAAAHSATRLRPDVALVCNPANVWAAMVLRASGVPVLLHLDGLEHRRIKWQGAGGRVQALAMLTAARSGLPLLTDSHAIRTWYERRLHASPQVIAYGSESARRDDERIARFSLQHKGYDLIVGRWEPENQLVEMVQAHAAACMHALVVVGEPAAGEYREQVLQAMAQHGRALSTGPVWDADVLSALYAGARCHLHGHTVGGTNPALLQGAGSGAEVLAHANPFNAEVVGAYGWLWQDVAELQQLLAREPWRDAPRAQQLVEAALQRYSWDAVISEYDSALQALAR